MLVITSAGNEANDPWHYIIAPSDGDQVIGVAAVDQNRHWAPFSSIGPSSDNEVKPNVAAMGLASVVQRDNGELGTANGTSFSSPILTGMAACLWQAFPKASNWQVKSAIEESASHYSNPDTLLGYGIPDFDQAYSILQKKLDEQTDGKKYTVSPNPFVNELFIRANTPVTESTKVSISLIQSNGKLAKKLVFD